MRLLAFDKLKLNLLVFVCLPLAFLLQLLGVLLGLLLLAVQLGRYGLCLDSADAGHDRLSGRLNAVRALIVVPVCAAIVSRKIGKQSIAANRNLRLVRLPPP